MLLCYSITYKQVNIIFSAGRDDEPQLIITTLQERENQYHNNLWDVTRSWKGFHRFPVFYSMRIQKILILLMLIPSWILAGFFRFWSTREKLVHSKIIKKILFKNKTQTHTYILYICIHSVYKTFANIIYVLL